MQLAIFGNTTEAGFAHGWTDEAAIAVFGSATLDLTLHPPRSEATLSVAAIFGSIKVIVPPGARVTTQGVALFGESRVRVQPGHGPEILIKNLALFGNVSIVEGQGRAQSAPVSGEQVFPY